VEDKNILFIVEGETAEPKIIRRINKILNLDEDTNIYSYRTSIYELYEELKFDNYLEIALVLREKETIKRQCMMLSKEFVAIYLIFDFEPQHPKFDLEKIKTMNKFFNDSLDKGLLLINFPMIESMRHIKWMPDNEFIDRTVSKQEVLRYKELVGNESNYTDINLYNMDIILQQITHHFIKLNYLVNQTKELPNFSQLTEIINGDELIQVEYQGYFDDKLLVVSTIYYYVFELKSSHFYDMLQLPIIEELCS